MKDCPPVWVQVWAVAPARVPTPVAGDRFEVCPRIAAWPIVEKECPPGRALQPRMTTWAEIEKSFRRSYLRVAVLMMLNSLSEATPRALAMAVGIDGERLHQIMFGGGSYREALALVVLGLVEIVETPNGKIYQITAKGRRKARQLAARNVRRIRMREINRGVAREFRATGVGTPVEVRVTSVPTPVEPTAVAPPATSGCVPACLTDFRHACRS